MIFDSRPMRTVGRLSFEPTRADPRAAAATTGPKIVAKAGAGECSSQIREVPNVSNYVTASTLPPLEHPTFCVAWYRGFSAAGWP